MTAGVGARGRAMMEERLHRQDSKQKRAAGQSPDWRIETDRARSKVCLEILPYVYVYAYVYVCVSLYLRQYAPVEAESTVQ